MTMRHALPLLLLLASLSPARATAQWQLSLVTGWSATAGHSRDPVDQDQPAILPDRPQNWSLAVARQRRGWRIAVDGSRITADLAVRSTSTTLATRGALSAWGLGAEVGRRIAGRGDGSSLWGSVGAVYERWSFDVTGGDSRWRAAARGALQLNVPFGAHWAGLLRGELLAGPSLFRPEELPEGYGIRSARRATLQVGVTLAGMPR
ncbi:MAG: hypothetical protein V4503_04855 [Gemmatimonadota bacterium]